MSKPLHKRVLGWLTWQRIVLVACGTAFVVGIVVYFFVPRYYSSSASVLVSKSLSAPAGLSELEGLSRLGLDRQESSLARMQEILQSRRLRSDLVQKYNLESKLGASQAGALKWLKNNTQIRVLGFGGGVGLRIQVQCSGSSRIASWIGNTGAFTDNEARQICAELANDYVTLLDEYLTATNVKSAQNTKEFIQERLATVKANLNDTEEHLQQLRQRYLLMEPDAKAKALYEAIQNASTTYESTTHTVREISQELSETRVNLTREETDRIAREVIARNPKIASLHEKLAGLEAQLAAERADGKSSQHPDVRTLESRIHNINQQLDETTKEVQEQVVWQPNPLYDNLRDHAAQLEAQLAGLQARQESLQQEISESEGKLREFPAIAREYMDTERKRQLQSEIATTLARQLELANIQVQKDTSDTFDVLDEAVVPEKKSGPSTVKTAGRAFIIVLVILVLGLLYHRGLFVDYGEPYSQQANDRTEVDGA